MQDNQAHSVEDPLPDPLDDGVIHLMVRPVAPPEEDVGPLQHVPGKTLFRHLHGGRADIELALQVELP